MCELCAAPVGGRHGHVADLQARTLRCACMACHLLFSPEGAGGGHLRAVPDRVLSFPGLRLAPAEWDALQIPVGVAFLSLSSTLGRVAAFYPGPAGATESLLALDTWESVIAAHPELGTLLPDVEALLVRSGPDDDVECYLVPIDACYELVGRMRLLWRGFEGGAAAAEALEAFFDDVRDRARPAT